MKKSVVQQASYKGGMIEGIKQDALAEAGNGTLMSVSWLENYNHTLQEESALKRWGEVDSGIPELDMGFYAPNEVYEYVINGGNTLEIDRASWIQGIQTYSVVYPESTNNYTAFLKRHPNTTVAYGYDFVPEWIRDEGYLQDSEAVAVVSYTVAKDGDTPAWQEVWADGNLDYPGWYTFGTLADVTRYGETLLFTTTLQEAPYYDSTGTENPVNQYLYPVYRYLYWDITRKRKDEAQFMETFDRTTDDFSDLSTDTTSKYQKWKVISPGQSLTNTTVGIVDGVVDGVVATNYDGSTTKYDINVSIEECCYTARKTVGGVGDYMVPFMTDDAYKTSKNLAWSATEDGVTISTTATVTTFEPYLTVTSYEELDIESLNLVLYNVAKNSGTISLGGGVNPYDGYRENPRTVMVGQEIQRADIVHGDEVWSAPRFLRYVEGTKLARYTESRSPRLWLQDEVLDLVLTVNIGGIDILLWRGQYTVQQNVSNLNIDLDPAFITAGVRPLPWLRESLVRDVLSICADDGIYNSWIDSHSFYFPQGRCIGDRTSYANYVLYQAYGTMLNFTLDISVEKLTELIDISATSLSLWCNKPDSSRHILKSVGANLDLPSGNLYTRGLEQGSESVDYTKFALLKQFIIDGKADPPISYAGWKNDYTLATNSWFKRSDGTDYYYTAVPLVLDPTGNHPMYKIPLYSTDANVRTYLDAPLGTAPRSDMENNYWTPDFVIWDYPTETTLFLNSSGKYWKGLGAKLITVIKGRTFIGGCIGADGIEEQAILRYSDVQGGAISPDIFSEERKIQVGHRPHTALIEFREQLLAFSRYQFYRIGMASITQEETWEFFDVVEQGCFNNKSVVVVPYGVVFCNEAGVWVTDGGEPQNLALPVLPTYQSISSGTEYLYTTINELPGVPYIDEKAVNPYLELNYDSFNDEILVSTPLFEAVVNDDNNADVRPVVDFTLVFSFKYKTWRIETSVVPEFEVEIQT